MGKKYHFAKFSISIPETLFRQLEEKRGLIPRSRWIAKAVEKQLKEG